MDNAKISKLVEELPICKDVKEKVTSILKELGYTHPTVRSPKPGEVWEFGGSYIFILNNDGYHYFNNKGAPSGVGAYYFYKREGWKFVAESISEAFEVMISTKKK